MNTNTCIFTDSSTYGAQKSPITVLIRDHQILEEEIQWMLSKRPLIFDFEQLCVDYGKETAEQMVSAFKQKGDAFFKTYAPALAHHGVGSRWKQFLEFLAEETTQRGAPTDAIDSFKKFAQYLGRVVSYRALSLTPSQFETIKNADSIWPSGRLKTDEKELDDIVRKFGVRYVAYARLYIGMQLIPFDPSLSLHDDPETAVCIAGGYVDNEKKVHLMELSVPKIEVLGFILSDIQDGNHKWFCFRKIWFDSFDERTERYTLYEIPFFSKRCRSVRIFQSNQEITAFLQPFKIAQEKKKLESSNQTVEGED